MLVLLLESYVVGTREEIEEEAGSGYTGAMMLCQTVICEAVSCSSTGVPFPNSIEDRGSSSPVQPCAMLSVHRERVDASCSRQTLNCQTQDRKCAQSLDYLSIFLTWQSSVCSRVHGVSASPLIKSLLPAQLVQLAHPQTFPRLPSSPLHRNSTSICTSAAPRRAGHLGIRPSAARLVHVDSHVASSCRNSGEYAFHAAT